MNINKLLISKKGSCAILLVTCVILLLPLIAMQFTDEVNWEASDFIVAGVLLAFFGYLHQALTQASNNKLIKAIIGLGVFVLFVFVWATLI